MMSLARGELRHATNATTRVETWVAYKPPLLTAHRALTDDFSRWDLAKTRLVRTEAVVLFGEVVWRLALGPFAQHLDTNY